MCLHDGRMYNKSSQNTFIGFNDFFWFNVPEMGFLGDTLKVLCSKRVTYLFKSLDKRRTAESSISIQYTMTAVQTDCYRLPIRAEFVTLALFLQMKRLGKYKPSTFFMEKHLGEAQKCIRKSYPNQIPYFLDMA